MQSPEKLLVPYVREGMTVLEPGPGMGFFTLLLARMVGSTGRVVAVDIQPKMLEVLQGRALKAGLQARIKTKLAQQDSMQIDDLKGSVDFVLAFAMVHEVPSAEVFFAEASAALRSGGLLLLVEPAGHVNSEQFDAELEAARKASLGLSERLLVRGNLAAVLRKV
ncbi:MAG: class I SAM-dependent methyltransferase [Terracidiphilus sp.]|jgi:ubiquinone/menaquinone biosynthesis C-methylase UbiE